MIEVGLEILFVVIVVVSLLQIVSVFVYVGDAALNLHFAQHIELYEGILGSGVVSFVVIDVEIMAEGTDIA